PLRPKRLKPPDLRRPADHKKGPAATPGLLFLVEPLSLEILRTGRALGGQPPRRDAGGDVGRATRQLGAAVEAEGLLLIGPVQTHVDAAALAVLTAAFKAGLADRKSTRL